LQQEDERAGAAVHDRDFGTRDVDVQVVDAEAGERRQDVLDRRDAGAAVLQRRRQPRVAHVPRVGGNGDRGREVDAMEDHARVGAAGRRTRSTRTPV